MLKEGLIWRLRKQARVNLRFPVSGYALVIVLSAFTCLLFQPLSLNAAARESIACEWTGIEKVIAVGDLHGDYENFVIILRGTAVVDEDLRWRAGKTHFVQTGDIIDRGPEARKIFDLLMRLENEAAEAGGKVHVLIGNHEEINITGIAFRYPDYVTLDQFISFLPDDYRKQKERELKKKILSLQGQADKAHLENIINEFWKAVRSQPSGQKKYISGFNEKYGSWLLKKNAAIKINNVVFVHGGISEKYSKWKIEEINERLRMELTDLRRVVEYSQPSRIGQPLIAYRGDGPLWYRELADGLEEEIQGEVDKILANLGAEHMVIAHTPRIAATPDQMMRFGGKVWVVDTGIAKVYGGHPSALIIQNGEFIVWGGEHEKRENLPLAHFSFMLLWPRMLGDIPTGP